MTSGCHQVLSASVSTSPREMASASTPRRFSAKRITGSALSTAEFSLCSPRTVTSCSPLAVTSLRRSPIFTLPAAHVPVTTVPAPLIEKARSIHIRAGIAQACCRTSSAGSSLSMPPRSSSIPSPVRADTAKMGATDKDVPATLSRTLASLMRCPLSMRVRTIMPRSMPSASMASRCSEVCSFQPSSAAITSMTAGAGPRPASVLAMKRSWPGTSTKATSAPDFRVVHAKPKSMVSPRCFSSSQRSGSIVVSALTSVDLPWSTCPAVAITYIYSACSCARRIAAASFSSSLAGMHRISIKHWPLCTRGNTAGRPCRSSGAKDSSRATA